MTTTTRRPDASMTLLREMMERPLDPGYAAEADRREAAGMPRSTGLRSMALTIAAVLLGLLLSVSAITLNRDAPAVTKTKSTLIGQIDTARTGAERQTRQVGDLQAQISAAEGRHGDDLATQLRDLEAETAATAVTGPGMVITMDDAPGVDDTSPDGNPRTSTATAGGTVLSRDVQIIANGLWEAGAEAITINGQRLSSRSAIRFAGDAILVNFRPLTRPYVIAAIGDPASLPTDFAEATAGSYLAALKSNFGIRVDTTTKKSITMPGATSLTVRVARPVNPAGASGTTTSGTGATGTTRPGNTKRGTTTSGGTP